jgi:hypothetical protein
MALTQNTESVKSFKALARLFYEMGAKHAHEAAVQTLSGTNSERHKEKRDEQFKILLKNTIREEFPGIEALPNYVVTINCRDKYECETPRECWEVIGAQPFGSGHMVSSPVGLPVGDFVPF